MLFVSGGHKHKKTPLEIQGCLLELISGFEPPTSSLPMAFYTFCGLSSACVIWLIYAVCEHFIFCQLSLSFACFRKNKHQINTKNQPVRYNKITLPAAVTYSKFCIGLLSSDVYSGIIKLTFNNE